ncbi:MAG: hypothetical protein QW688_07475 [Thermoprotei archaeon]
MHVEVKPLFLVLALLAMLATPLPHVIPSHTGLHGGLGSKILARLSDVIPRVPKLTGVQQPLSGRRQQGLRAMVTLRTWQQPRFEGQ